MLHHMTSAPSAPYNFVRGMPKDADTLTQFALDSNAIYQSRKVTDDEARKVFELTERDCSTGIVELLKFYDDVIGFYSLRSYKNSEGKKIKELGHLFIKPGSVGHGFGSFLFLRAMQMAKYGLRWRTIGWFSDQHAAGFYHKMGARQIGSSGCKLNPACEVPLFSYEL